MTDLAERVAQAEDRSFARDVQELIDNQHEAPIFDGVRWTCRRVPVSSKGEEQ